MLKFQFIPGHVTIISPNTPYLFKFQLDPSRTVSPNTPGFMKQPKLEDQIHCTAIVLDASTVDAADAIKDTIQNIKDMQTVMNSMGKRLKINLLNLLNGLVQLPF